MIELTTASNTTLKGIKESLKISTADITDNLIGGNVPVGNIPGNIKIATLVASSCTPDALGSSAIDLQQFRSDTSQTASGVYAVISGGQNNTASGYNSTVGGGVSNAARANNTTVSGGYSNVAANDSSSVGGGFSNSAYQVGSTVSGGCCNTAANSHSAVGGGCCNVAGGSTLLLVEVGVIQHLVICNSRWRVLQHCFQLLCNYCWREL